MTAEHVHEFDAYFVVVEGTYVLRLNGKEIHVQAGQEYHIPRGTRIAGRATAGTRIMHMFDGQRAKRAEAN